MAQILDSLRLLIANNQDLINDWFAKQYTQTPPCFYNSVDLRHSGQKLAPVDTNIFPAGFNNLSAKGSVCAALQAKNYLTTYAKDAKNLLIIPEDHTRNLFYLDNIANLQNILMEAGMEVRIGTTDKTHANGLELVSASGQKLLYNALIVQDKILACTDGFVPDIIIMNNDMSIGIPEVLVGITQPIIPSISLGWYRRRKSAHFTAYNAVLQDFRAVCDIDPFFLSTEFYRCGSVQFKEKIGLECLALGVEKTLQKLREKYQKYGIDDEPYVFVKADNGTYGMGIMTVNSGDELLEMNKKLRNKMDVIKGGVANSDIIVQEGIKTIDRIKENVAEPMIYLLNGQPVSCIYRVNSERNEFGNLNAQGMHFAPDICEERSYEAKGYVDPNCKYNAFALVAKLAALAAAREVYI